MKRINFLKNSRFNQVDIKKIIALCLFLVSAFALQAQQLKGTQQYSELREFGGSRYTIVNWNVNYQIILKEDAFYIRLSNPRISASPTSLYGNPNGGKLYSKTDLGLSTWPDSDPTPYNMSLQLTLLYPDGTYHKTSAVVGDDNFIERISQFNKLKNASPGSFKVASVEYMGYNGGADNKLDVLIAAKKNGKTIATAGNISNNNPATNEIKAANDPVTDNTTNSGNSNPMTNKTYNTPSYSTNKTVEAIGQISNAVTPLLDQWGASLQKKREAEKKKELEDAERKKGTAEWYFKTQLDKYLVAADNGDETARMSLISEYYYASWTRGYDFEHIIPNWRKWLITASENKNLDAMNIIGLSSIKKSIKAMPSLDLTSEQGIQMLENAANLNSLDAMLTLAVYYDTNKKCIKYIGDGGNDPEKAIYWLTKAAENGSSTAMERLGQIYSKGTTNLWSSTNCNIKYNVKKNEKIASDWFLKSKNTLNEEETLFRKTFGGWGM